MRVMVLHNLPVLSADHPEAASEEQAGESVMAVCHLLSRAGHEVTSLPIGREMSVLDCSLTESAPDVVFNLFEGLADDPTTEVRVAQILERRRVPFTGSPAAALACAGNKAWTKRRLRRAGLPTPAGMVISRLPVPDCAIGWPVMLKPALRHGSEGIAQGNVVTDVASYRRRVAALLRTHGPVLVEQFVHGPEFMVSVVEGAGRRLPVLGYRFRDPRRWSIASYDGKWAPGSADYLTMKVEVERDLPNWQTRVLRRLGRQAFEAVGCRDYARIEIRWPRDGRPVILDVNANCDLGPQSYLAWSLERVEVGASDYYSALIERAWVRRA